MKSYAFYDMIGIKELIKKGTAKKTLDDFLDCAQKWAVYGSDKIPHATPVGETHTELPVCRVATFSDSALMTTTKEFQPDVFFTLATDLLESFKRNSGCVYCIISRGEDIPSHESSLPNAGDVQNPAYYQLAGSGEAWANLFYADSAISRNEDWHSSKYDLYVTGNVDIPSEYGSAGQMDFKDFKGETQTVFALRRMH